MFSSVLVDYEKVKESGAEGDMRGLGSGQETERGNRNLYWVVLYNLLLKVQVSAYRKRATGAEPSSSAVTPILGSRQPCCAVDRQLEVASVIVTYWTFSETASLEYCPKLLNLLLPL